LKSQLQAAPNDVDNWVLLGRTFASLERWGEARDAFAHAIALQPAEPALHAQMGEVLTLEAGGTVTAGASAEFAHAPDDPRARYYQAVALAQAGNTAQAQKALQALADEAPPQAAWRQLVLDELHSLGAASPSDAGLPPSITEELQNELASLDAPPAPRAVATPTVPRIGDLEDRVRAQPHDETAWMALSRAYQAAGDAAQAVAALRRANRAMPADLNLLLAYGDLLADGIRGDVLPEDLVGVMQQINAIDPNQADALWYLGVAAAHRGDAHRAAKFWRRLLAELPTGSKERASLQERLDALR
jgi:cytochrome c-type biogenesis protein CcmH